MGKSRHYPTSDRVGEFYFHCVQVGCAEGIIPALVLWMGLMASTLGFHQFSIIKWASAHRVQSEDDVFMFINEQTNECLEEVIIELNAMENTNLSMSSGILFCDKTQLLE